MLRMRQVSVYVRSVQLANETRVRWTSISYGPKNYAELKRRETRAFQRLRVSHLRRLISPVGTGNWLISGG